jgi:hypothetical protein
MTTIYRRFSNPRGHHANAKPLSTCPECARLELGKTLAKTQREKDQWDKLLADHLSVKWTPAQPGIFEEANR